MPNKSYLLGLAWPLLLLAGCVGPVTTLEPPRTVEPWRVELVAGASVPVHGVFVSSMAKAIQRGTDRLRAANTAPLSDRERADLDQAALAAVLFQPTVVPEIKARLGLIERIDVGFRYAGPTLKFDAKYNFWRSESLDIAASAGYVYHTGIGASIAQGIYQLFDDLKLVEYSRSDVDLAVLVSGPGDKHVFPYGAVRWIIGMPDFETKLPPAFVQATGIENSKVDTLMHYVGATGGIRAGGKKVAFLGELTLMYLVFSPEVLGERRNLGGIVVSPAIALDVRF
jgi:hypothetical protein